MLQIFLNRPITILLPTILALVFACPLRAEGQLTPSIVGPEMVGWIEKDGDGFFIEALDLAAREAGYELRFESRPLARSLLEFDRGSFDCYASGDRAAIEGYLEKSVEVVTSVAFNTETLRALTLQHKPLVTSIDDLRDKTIGIMLGGNPELFGIGEFNDSILEVPELKTLVELLELGRLDVVIEYDTIYHQFPGKMHFDDGLQLYRIEHGVNCYPSERTLAFIEALNAALAELHQRGAIEDVFRRNLQ